MGRALGLLFGLASVWAIEVNAACIQGTEMNEVAAKKAYDVINCTPPAKKSIVRCFDGYVVDCIYDSSFKASRDSKTSTESSWSPPKMRCIQGQEMNLEAANRAAAAMNCASGFQAASVPCFKGFIADCIRVNVPDANQPDSVR